MSKLSVVDVFAGAGGFSEGFRMDGYDVKACLEIDKWAADTLRYNHGEGAGAKILEGDIQDFTEAATIRNAVGGTLPDVLIGGPPCQGFSVAGLRDPSDPRNSLFMNFSHWVDALQPSVFVMENVHGLLSRKNAQGEKVIGIIERRFADLGYNMNVWKLNAANFGVPQIRHRLFIVGSQNSVITPPTPSHAIPGSSLPLNQEAAILPAITVWEALSDLPWVKAGEGSEEQEYGPESIRHDYQRWAREGSENVYNHAAMLHTKRLIERFKQIQIGVSLKDMEEKYRVLQRSGKGSLSQAEYSSNYRHLRPEMVSHTVPASFYSTFIHPMEARNLTAREAARLQSFPDHYKFLGKRTQISSKLLARRGREAEDYLSQYNQIGNAVPPLLAKAIAAHVREHIESTSCKFTQPAGKEANGKAGKLVTLGAELSIARPSLVI